MEATRRTFIGGLGVLFLCAPAIVRASSLMPVSNRAFLKDYMVLYGWDQDGNQIEEWTEVGLPIPTISNLRPKWSEITGFVGPRKMDGHAFHAVKYTGKTRAPFYVDGPGLAQHNPDPRITQFSQNQVVDLQDPSWDPHQIVVAAR